MGIKKEKKCAKCGVVVKAYSYGSFCSSCADEVWDTGFESTSQHAEEQYEAALEKKREINEKLSTLPINYELIRKITKYTSGRYRCKKCGKLRLKWIHFGDDGNEAKLRKMLASECPKCNSTELTFE